jgi:hypothetical protein
MPSGLTISDPWGDLDPVAWEEFDTSFDRLFERLDRLWDEGVLPQKFHWARK